VSIAPSSPMLQRLLDVAALLPLGFVDQVLTPNPNNFKRNVRSAPIAATPPQPTDADAAEGAAWPLKTTAKQHVALLLSHSARSRMRPPPPAEVAMLAQHFDRVALHAVRELEAPIVPETYQTNLLFTNADAPSRHGHTTRAGYLSGKKLPQLYTIFALLPPLPPHPLRFLDVGGGRCDLALNLLDHLSSMGRFGDSITVLDNNQPSLDCGRRRLEGDARGLNITFVQSDFEAYAPREDFFATFGLHPCGSLTDQILRLASGFTTKAVIVVPCCYAKCRPDLGSAWLVAERDGAVLCRLCEKNEDDATSTRAMRVVNAMRLAHYRHDGWAWETCGFDRAFSKKNFVLVGRR